MSNKSPTKHSRQPKNHDSTRAMMSSSSDDPIFVRGVLRTQPDLQCLARALIELARQEIEAEDAAKAVESARSAVNPADASPDDPSSTEEAA